MWCHVLLGMPVIGLGLFFVLPFVTALTVYLIIVLLSLWLYYKIMESMHTPVITGREAIVDRIVSTDTDGAIHWRGEWWTAEPRLPNQRVRIVALRGLCLLVQPISEANSPKSASV